MSRRWWMIYGLGFMVELAGLLPLEPIMLLQNETNL